MLMQVFSFVFGWINQNRLSKCVHKVSRSLNYFFTLLNIDVGVGKLVNVLVAVTFIVHMVSCGWYWIDETNDFEPTGWVARQGLLQVDLKFRYISAVYWTFQTLTTVGYGDIPAVTLYEKVYATLWMIGGFGLYSYTIGTL